MRRSTTWIAAAAASLVATSAAWAGGFVNISKLGQWCLSDHPEEKSACEGYVAATYDRLWATGMFYDGTVACPPKSLTPQLLTETVVALLRKEQTTPEVIATVAVLESIQEKWPCGEGVNTGSMVKINPFHTRCTSSDYEDIAWCTGVIAGTSDAAAVLYENGNTYAESFVLDIRSLTWGDINEAVRQFVIDHPERTEPHDSPGAIIRDAVAD
ncbi:MAG: hypothetical protein KJP17_08840 [Gammaproteobacteria bacterium]|nr:hypothetical protein [Gammaproteobacteria bacterium]